MGGWKELINPKDRMETRTGLFFTRRFYQAPSLPNSTSLPSMYDAHPDSSLSRVLSITISPLGMCDNKNQALIKYSPLDEEDSQPPGTSFNDLPLTTATGGEMFTQEAEGADYYWLKAPNDRAEADVQLRIATGTVEITEIIESSQMAISSSTGAFRRSLIMSGRVNKASFRGLAPVNWLYNGGNFDRFRDETGALKYRVHHSFAYRIPDPSAITAGQGWRLLWNKEQANWDQITDTPGGTLSNPIPYTSGDFQRVFTTSGAN